MTEHVRCQQATKHIRETKYAAMLLKQALPYQMLFAEPPQWIPANIKSAMIYAAAS